MAAPAVGVASSLCGGAGQPRRRHHPPRGEERGERECHMLGERRPASRPQPPPPLALAACRPLLPPLPPARWRRCAPPPPRRAAASATGCWPSAARLACKPAGERAGLWLCGGRGVGWGGRIRLRHTPPTPTRPPPSLTRVCGSAAASRQSKRTALHRAAMAGQTSCVQSLVEAKADVCLKSLVSDDAEIGVGGRGEGCGARVVIKWALCGTKSGSRAYSCLVLVD